MVDQYIYFFQIIFDVSNFVQYLLHHFLWFRKIVTLFRELSQSPLVLDLFLNFVHNFKCIHIVLRKSRLACDFVSITWWMTLGKSITEWVDSKFQRGAGVTKHYYPRPKTKLPLALPPPVSL